MIQYRTTEISNSSIFGSEFIVLSNIAFDKISFDNVTSTVQADHMKYKNIMATINIHTADATNIFFALKYFWITQTGESTKNEIKLPNHKNIHTIKALFNCNKKKNTNVKWKHIHTKDDMNQ